MCIFTDQLLSEKIRGKQKYEMSKLFPQHNQQRGLLLQVGITSAYVKNNCSALTIDKATLYISHKIDTNYSAYNEYLGTKRLKMGCY